MFLKLPINSFFFDLLYAGINHRSRYFGCFSNYCGATMTCSYSVLTLTVCVRTCLRAYPHRQVAVPIHFHYSLLTTPHSPLTTPHSLLTTPHSLLTTPLYIHV